MKKFLLLPSLALLLSCSSGEEHNAVDLGLSVLWADCNVGANLPEEFGDYYAWGDTMANRPYGDDLSAYPHCKDLDGDGNIASSDEFSYIGDDISGKEQYDAATAKWGNGWRMPSYEQFEELLTKCVWAPCEKNGVKGFQVVGPNGNSIFLPIAGKKGFESDPEDLCYWTSKFGAEDKAVALRSGKHRPLWALDRPYQAPIRPVKIREYKE